MTHFLTGATYTPERLTVRKCIYDIRHMYTDDICNSLRIDLSLLFGCFGANGGLLTHLIHELQVREKWDVFGPFHSAEEQSGRQLADILNAHQVVSLHALCPVAGRWVGLGAQQQRYEAGQVGLSVVRVSAVCQVLPRAALGI